MKGQCLLFNGVMRIIGQKGYDDLFSSELVQQIFTSRHRAIFHQQDTVDIKNEGFQFIQVPFKPLMKGAMDSY